MEREHPSAQASDVSVSASSLPSGSVTSLACPPLLLPVLLLGIPSPLLSARSAVPILNGQRNLSPQEASATLQPRELSSFRSPHGRDREVAQ